MNSYTEKIESLLSEEITELVVEKDEFYQFREAWVAHPKKNMIVGEASLGGKVIYRKDKQNL
ncbi:hypothetical protein DOK76_02160 [Vagococcus sp. DIV0080]|uniref:Uncharacterized protein n=1 Tax=Candidatus Vagococcus giribetii TaxID=2230876 RepID=A0ABS3HQD8_9ENTE|nr:hypothetical protein [Vagococcus sp. DIV0080]MBO0475856.1 hypothetical protein [Vagococcus sp. DIV0080]